MPLDPNWTPNIEGMRLALRQAKMAEENKDVPVGAVIFHGTTLIAQAHNQVEMLHDPTAHAEVLAITQAAAALGDWRLTDTVMYVTKEPCPMCAGAIVLARIPLVVWGMTDPQRGGAVSAFNIFQSNTLNHRTDYVEGVMKDECLQIMQGFFQGLRSGGDRRERGERGA
ncbi:MAG: nucleoside deaminase [bacterium]